jgi:hypothetical protein
MRAFVCAAMMLMASIAAGGRITASGRARRRGRVTTRDGARGWGERNLGLSPLSREGGADAGARSGRTGSTRQCAARRRQGQGRCRFAATGRAYVRFALTNPALFRLIFTSSAQIQATGEVEALQMLRARRVRSPTSSCWVAIRRGARRRCTASTRSCCMADAWTDWP